MTTTEEPPPSSSQDSAPREPAPPNESLLRSRRDSREFLVVLGFAYLPSLFTSALFYLAPVTSEGRSAIYYLDDPVRMAQMCIPLLYIVHLRGAGWQSLGIVRIRWFDLLLAIPTLLAGFFASYLGMSMYSALTRADAYAQAETIRSYFATVKQPLDYALIALASLSVGFGEELLFRGYLLRKWQKLSGSLPQAIVVSSLLFGLAHVYQGGIGIASAMSIGVAYGLSFAWLRRLWPIALAHALTDFLTLSSY